MLYVRPAHCNFFLKLMHLSLPRYTLLLPGDLPRYLGCDLVRNDAPIGLVLLGTRKLPLPFSELASREQLFTWLSRVLIYTVIPGHGGSSRGFRVRLPNNLVAFFDLVIYLHGVGFPGHWLSEFLQSILNNNLITDVAPYVGRWPIPVSDMKRRVPRRKVNLEPWLVEIDHFDDCSHRAAVRCSSTRSIPKLAHGYCHFRDSLLTWLFQQRYKVS